MPSAGKGVRPAVQCVKLETDARALAGQGGVACLTRPIAVSALRAVSEAGDLMPQKSTYFYPKLATGLVARSLASET